MLNFAARAPPQERNVLIGMAAIEPTPGLVWYRPMAGVSVPIAVDASAAALPIFSWLPTVANDHLASADDAIRRSRLRDPLTKPATRHPGSSRLRRTPGLRLRAPEGGMAYRNALMRALQVDVGKRDAVVGSRRR
jgi:hypothetical protein